MTGYTVRGSEKVMGSGAWFSSRELRLEFDRGSVAVMHNGEIVGD